MAYKIIDHSDSHWEFNDESNKLLKLLDFKWLAIAILGRNNIVKSFSIWFLIVPFIIKLLDKIPESLSVVLFEEKFSFHLATPFPSQIYWFFFASVLFAFGNLIYSIRCPGIIKSFKSYAEYKEIDGSSVSSIFALEEFCDAKETTSKDNDAVVFDFVDKYCEVECKNECVAQESWHLKLNYCRVSEKDIPNIFSHVRQAANYLHRRSRQVCALLYILGLLIISFILCQNIYLVLSCYFGSA